MKDSDAQADERTAIEGALREADTMWTARFGAGSRRELHESYSLALEGLRDQPGSGASGLGSVRSGIELEHRRRYGDARLAAEASDERARNRALEGDAGLVTYEQKWARRLDGLLRAHPARWQLPGLSGEELRDELTLRLVETLRSRPERLPAHEHAGKEWGLAFFGAERRSLRRSFQLKVVLVEPPLLLDRAPTEEERLLEAESARLHAVARERAEDGLTRPQRRWLAALERSAAAGEFFATSGQPNLAAAARLLERDRSSAQRAFGELKRRYAQELAKLEG